MRTGESEEDGEKQPKAEGATCWGVQGYLTRWNPQLARSGWASRKSEHTGHFASCQNGHLMNECNSLTEPSSNVFPDAHLCLSLTTAQAWSPLPTQRSQLCLWALSSSLPIDVEPLDCLLSPTIESHRTELRAVLGNTSGPWVPSGVEVRLNQAAWSSRRHGWSSRQSP